VSEGCKILIEALIALAFLAANYAIVRWYMPEAHAAFMWLMGR
jgi:hypothetical protein